ncbi:MAG: hypothetical protein Q8P57_00410 [Candidatus Pacearchaeota archaeon]|nr:hypothetical protein [Candidatus Pacearchaeota archaeon]
MPDMQKLNENKQKILYLIQSKGPSLPTRIANETKIQPLFASAFLAEMVSEKILKISNMKVGSSPIYYLKGQEEKLENFIEHLNHKEKESFLLLKDKKILEDQKQEPAIRVALRKIKDFAVPVPVRVDGEIRLFWKFFLIQESETKNLIESVILKKSNSEKQEIQEIPKPQIIENTQINPERLSDNLQENTLNIFEKSKIPQEQSMQKIPQEQSMQKTLSQQIPEKMQVKIQPIQTDKEPINKKQKIPPQDSEFAQTIKKHLLKNNIEIMEEISSKKKEFISKVTYTDLLFGKQDFYLISKDKKKVTENDLALALQKAQSEKMPALIVSSAELEKKAKEYLEEWRNLIKYKKI